MVKDSENKSSPGKGATAAEMQRYKFMPANCTIAAKHGMVAT
jgi:hypothetical protein